MPGLESQPLESRLEHQTAPEHSEKANNDSRYCLYIKMCNVKWLDGLMAILLFPLLS
jgi:hypothetical protein